MLDKAFWVPLSAAAEFVRPEILLHGQPKFPKPGQNEGITSIIGLEYAASKIMIQIIYSLGIYQLTNS